MRVGGKRGRSEKEAQEYDQLSSDLGSKRAAFRQVERIIHDFAERVCTGTPR